jgi:hypothetical protein
VLAGRWRATCCARNPHVGKEARAAREPAPAHVVPGGGGRAAVPLPGGRLDADALRGAIAAGATPALLVGSAVTVNTGAIDPLDALAEVAAAERLWFHVDGVYGSFGCSTPALAARYRAWSAPTR